MSKLKKAADRQPAMINIDMDKPCAKCGEDGAAPSGLCIKCVVEKRLSISSGERKDYVFDAAGMRVRAVAAQSVFDGAKKAARSLAEEIDKAESDGVRAAEQGVLFDGADLKDLASFEDDLSRVEVLAKCLGKLIGLNLSDLVGAAKSLGVK